MMVAVGSNNPVKIRAVKHAFKKAFTKPFEIVALEVSSGVPNQPRTDAETYKGALNRARKAQKIAEADFGIGIEGGIQQHNHGVFSNAWVAVVDKSGQVGRGSSARFQLPAKVLKLMRKGDELGVAIDRLVSGKGLKRRGGAYSALTAGKLSRSKAYEQAVICALMPFLTPAYWD